MLLIEYDKKVEITGFSSLADDHIKIQFWRTFKLSFPCTGEIKDGLLYIDNGPKIHWLPEQFIFKNEQK